MAEVLQWEPLRAALRYSLKASAWSASAFESSAQARELDEGRRFRSGDDEAHFRELVQCILFSRRFIISYNPVLIGILLALTAVHWREEIGRWRRRRRRSIAEGEDNMVQGDADELSALLLRKPGGAFSTKGSSARATVRSWLLHQPRPIPLINKVLPSNRASLAVVLLLGLNVFFLFYKTPLTIPMLFVFSDRAALVFVANLPLLYLLAAKNQPVKVLTGRSYESLNMFHRRLGELLCLLALLHSAGMTGVWYTLLRPQGFTLARFLLSKIILLGLGAFIAYELIYVTSLGSFRQRWYELFLVLHIVLQVAALVLVWFHHSGSRPYVGIALGIFLIDRLALRHFLKSTTAEARLEVMDDGETVKLSTRFPPSSGPESRRMGMPSGWKATDHVFASIPGLSWKHNLQAHPFTISSIAPSPSSSAAELRLIIRAQDGFSRELLEYATNHDSARVRFDGPYGSHSALNMLHDSDIAVLIAGGSGVAVTWPLAWSLAQSSKRSYDPEDMATSTTRKKRVLFVWIVHQASHMLWIGHQSLADLRAAGVDVLIPEPTSKLGRPDLEGIVRSWVESTDRVDDSSVRSKLGLLCSGPDGMNRTVQNLCSSFVGEGKDASVEIEKYGW